MKLRLRYILMLIFGAVLLNSALLYDKTNGFHRGANAFYESENSENPKFVIKLLRCLEKNGPENTSIRIQGPRSSSVPKNNLLYVNGFLGWHTTWLVAIDPAHTTPVSLETCDDVRINYSAFGRSPVPGPIKQLLATCGVPVSGFHVIQEPARGKPTNDQTGNDALGRASTFKLPPLGKNE